MDERNRVAFWGAACGAFLIVCVPSTFFLDALSRYRKYVSGVDVTSPRPMRVRLVPHRDGRDVESVPRLDFVEFSIRKPKAKSVTLIGDFNGWKGDALPLSKRANGRWDLVLPLPKGRHHYLFLVDGQPETDPTNPQTALVGGRLASVKAVP